MTHRVSFIFCIDRKVEFSRGKIPLLGSAPNEPIVQRLESMKNEYNRPTTDTLTGNMNCYVDITPYDV